MLRVLRIARQTAIRARTQASNAIKALLVTAPAELREQLRDLPTATLVAAAAALLPGPITSPLAAARLALGTLAQPHQALSVEIKTLTAELDRLTATAAPSWWRCSVSARTAPVCCWSPPATTPAAPQRACFSMLCGSSPIPASSGKTVRHRLTRGGDRQPTLGCTGSCWCGCAGTSRPRTT
jgi:transposase